MAIFDLFSKRQKRLRGEVQDVYTYDEIPRPLKVQIIHIWKDALGNQNQYHENYVGTEQAYKFIVDTLCREYGLFSLPTSQKSYGNRNYLEELANFLLEEEDVERVLDAVELSFRYIDRLTRKFDYLRKQNASRAADAAIEELNERFKGHGVGFQFANGEIIRVDSQFIHAEVVKPVT